MTHSKEVLLINNKNQKKPLFGNDFVGAKYYQIRDRSFIVQKIYRMGLPLSLQLAFK